MKSISALFLALALTGPSFAQASNTSARVYGKQQALSQQNVRLGEVLHVQEVRIQDQSYRLNTGSAVGASTGYLLSKNRSGTERTIAGLAGGAIGCGAATSDEAQSRGNLHSLRREERYLFSRPRR